MARNIRALLANWLGASDLSKPGREQSDKPPAPVTNSMHDALLREHKVVAVELGKVQARCTQLLNEKNAEIAALKEQLIKARAALQPSIEVAGNSGQAYCTKIANKRTRHFICR